MDDIKNLKISETEKERLLITRLNNRPNAMATYGQAKLTPEQMKEVFDQQFKLIVDRYNSLCDMLALLDDTYATDKQLEAGVKSAKGASGNVSIVPAMWSNNSNGITSSLMFPNLGANDMIMFSPASPEDKEKIVKYDLFIQAETIGQTVNFYASQEPTEPISLFYFIARGV